MFQCRFVHARATVEDGFLQPSGGRRSGGHFDDPSFPPVGRGRQGGPVLATFRIPGGDRDCVDCGTGPRRVARIRAIRSGALAPLDDVRIHIAIGPHAAARAATQEDVLRSLHVHRIPEIAALRLPIKDCPTLGRRIQPDIAIARHMMMFPCMAISSLVLGLNLLADGMREISLRD